MHISGIYYNQRMMFKLLTTKERKISGVKRHSWATFNQIQTNKNQIQYVGNFIVFKSCLKLFVLKFILYEISYEKPISLIYSPNILKKLPIVFVATLIFREIWIYFYFTISNENGICGKNGVSASVLTLTLVLMTVVHIGIT